MRIKIKAEVTGGFSTKNPISFTLNDVSVTFFTFEGKNFIEATRQVTDYKLVIDNPFENHNLEEPLLRVLKSIESIGSFLIRIQEIKYDERETSWIAESDKEKTIVDRLPSEKRYLYKDNSVIEISEDKIEQIVSLCSTKTDDLFVFEFLRQGNVSFRKDNFYNAFINYFMLLEETFGNGFFKTKQLEESFINSDVLHMCVLSAIELLSSNPLELLCVEWVQNEVERHDRTWDYMGIVHCIVRFRGDYFHSKMRTKVLDHREQYFKYMAIFTQRICIIYCLYLINSSGMNADEKRKYVIGEIERLKSLWF